MIGFPALYSEHYGEIKSFSEPLKLFQQNLKKYAEVFNINSSDTLIFLILQTIYSKYKPYFPFYLSFYFFNIMLPI